VKSPDRDAAVVRVVIVARDRAFHQEVRRLFDALEGMRICGEAFDAVAGTVICALGAPDVIVTDAHQPWTDARELLRRARAIRPQARIVTCTMVSATETYAAVTDPAAPERPLEDLVHALERARRGHETTSVGADGDLR